MPASDSSSTNVGSSSSRRTPLSRQRSSSSVAAKTVSGSRRRRRSERDADDEAEDATEAGPFFEPGDGEGMTRKLARTISDDVNETSKQKFSELGDDLRAQLLGQLTRYLLFKGSRAEPIARQSIKKECAWDQFSTFSTAWLDVLLGQEYVSVCAQGQGEWSDGLRPPTRLSTHPLTRAEWSETIHFEARYRACLSNLF